MLCDCFFDHLGTDLPSATRWCTFSPRLALQAGAWFTHGLLRRVLQRSFEPQGPRDHGNEDEADFHASANRKLTTSLTFLENSEECALTLGLAVLATHPVDHLSLRLQALDRAGGAMDELTSRAPGGLLPVALRKYWLLHNVWYDSPEAEQANSILGFMDAFGVSRRNALNGLRDK
eukprot:3561272-Pyramimonas_sp.AAC.1